MRAIIVAAGRGRRLGKETDEIPKCMVRVGGRPILHWQLEALRSAGVDDVVVVRGYLGDRIDGGGTPLRFIENAQWAETNILASALCAAAEMDDGFFFSYSDIVYTPAVTKTLVASRGTGAPSAALVIDRRWDEAYVGRTQHPVSEAELARVEGTGADAAVVRVGKRLVPQADAAGEFIGLAYVSAQGARHLREVWQRALAEGGLDAPFGAASALRQAYLTDGLNAMIADGARLAPAFIDGHWREIDTEQDLAAAERTLATWT